jgi:hypothetical protein
MSQPKIKAIKSFNDGRIKIGLTMDCGYHYPTAKIDAKVEITTLEARALATEILALADADDAKIAKKQEADARPQKWRHREVAAGRRVVLSAGAFFK